MQKRPSSGDRYFSTRRKSNLIKTISVPNAVSNCVMRFYAVLLLVVFISVLSPAFQSHAQQVTIKGKITDAETGDGLPFVTVFVKGGTTGTTTDFEGYYQLQMSKVPDSLFASYIGYLTLGKALLGTGTQTVNFVLKPDVVMAQEVVISNEENPAWAIMRKVMENKKLNDKRSLVSFEYDSYNKIEVDVDNISQKLRDKKIMQKVLTRLDSIRQITGEDGKPILPIFISETMSKYYFSFPPQKTREDVIANKIQGIGFDDRSLISQFIGPSYQEYNFYRSYMSIFDKEFVSPIADSWKIYYEYFLADSMYVGDDWCYRIEFEPKRPQDLAFKGVMWITANEYALRRMDATVGKEANLNFIEKIKIQQELEKTAGGPWVPTKVRALLDLGEITDSSAGILVKAYVSNKNIKINQEYPQGFFDVAVNVSDDAKKYDENYWQENRHDPLTEEEQDVFKMINTMKKIPVLRSYLEIINIAVNGYKSIGLIDFGPYLFTYANNDVEGSRFQLGIRSNYHFSKKLFLSGYGAYGELDNTMKYSGDVRYVFSRKHWTEVMYRHTRDINQVGLMSENVDTRGLFGAFVRWGELKKPLMQTENNFYISRAWSKTFTQTVTARNLQLKPMFDFSYLEQYPVKNDTVIGTDLNTTELIVESSFGEDETFIQNEYSRISMGPRKWPVFTFRYTMGLKGVLNSHFNYQKYTLNVVQLVRLGVLGRLRYSLTGSIIEGAVPYPLLENHLGNQTYFFNINAFNMMNFFEFTSDRYVSFNLRHQFDGFFLNRIPVMRKWKWREVAWFNGLMGSISDDNFKIMLENPDSQDAVGPNPLGPIPYMEAGYGIENIFKFLRVDFLHRITYTDKPGVANFGIKVSAQFRL